MATALTLYRNVQICHFGVTTLRENKRSLSLRLTVPPGNRFRLSHGSNVTRDVSGRGALFRRHGRGPAPRRLRPPSPQPESSGFTCVSSQWREKSPPKRKRTTQTNHRAKLLDMEIT